MIWLYCVYEGASKTTIISFGPQGESASSLTRKWELRLIWSWPWKLTSPTKASKHRQASRNLCTCTLRCHLATKRSARETAKQSSYQIQITVITLASPTSQHPLYSIQEVQDSSLRATASFNFEDRKMILRSFIQQAMRTSCFHPLPSHVCQLSMFMSHSIYIFYHQVSAVRRPRQHHSVANVGLIYSIMSQVSSQFCHPKRLESTRSFQHSMPSTKKFLVCLL